MRIIDSHFHWWPRSVSERLCKRTTYPRAEVNGRGGYTYLRQDNVDYVLSSWAEWFDLDRQLAHMDGLGHQVDVVCSIGPFSVFFSDLPAEEGREAAIQWNEEMAGAQRKYPGRVWASAAVPLIDTKIAIEVLDDAVNRLGLMGVNLPGSIGSDARIDAERLQPFYARVEQLGLPIFLHPTDAVFADMLTGYDGRMDKNTPRAKLPKPASTYLKRMYTDTVSPHAAGLKFAIEYYGIDHVMYGTDYPCWDPATALALLNEIGLSKEDQDKLFYSNARRILGLREPAPAGGQQGVREPALT